MARTHCFSKRVSGNGNNIKPEIRDEQRLPCEVLGYFPGARLGLEKSGSTRPFPYPFRNLIEGDGLLGPVPQVADLRRPGIELIIADEDGERRP